MSISDLFSNSILQSEEIISLEVLPSSLTLPDVGHQSFYDFSVGDSVYVQIHGSVNPIGFWHLGTVIGIPNSAQGEVRSRLIWVSNFFELVYKKKWENIWFLNFFFYFDSKFQTTQWKKILDLFIFLSILFV
jgi:hypothetical protein